MNGPRRTHASLIYLPQRTQRAQRSIQEHECRYLCFSAFRLFVSFLCVLCVKLKLTLFRGHPILGDERSPPCPWVNHHTRPSFANRSSSWRTSVASRASSPAS